MAAETRTGSISAVQRCRNRRLANNFSNKALKELLTGLRSLQVLTFPEVLRGCVIAH